MSVPICRVAIPKGAHGPDETYEIICETFSVRAFLVARNAGQRPLRSAARFVVTVMPAGAERHPIVADHPDAQVFGGHPGALRGDLERNRAEGVADVLSHHLLVVVVYESLCSVRAGR